MQLKSTEQILQVYHRHLLPFIFSLIKDIFIGLPFYLLLYFALPSLSTIQTIIGFSIITFLLIVFALTQFAFYWWNKLIITNHRLLFVNWQGPFMRVEDSTGLIDIQDIKTKEKGLISHFRIFDYGTIEISTASAKIIITFTNAPDPEGIKKFIMEAKSAQHAEDDRLHQGLSQSQPVETETPKTVAV